MAHDGAQYAQGPVTCFVPGVPRSKGSVVSFYSPTQKRVITKADSKSMAAWCSDVGWLMKIAMRQAHVRCALPGVPVALELHFYFAGPARLPLVEPPDIDKLERAVLDALTGILYDDDAQVYTVTKDKHTVAAPDEPGVAITATFGQRVPTAGAAQRAHPQGRQTRPRRARSGRDHGGA
jgi:crossover junction endodeoxyribonuclease RusA